MSLFQTLIEPERHTNIPYSAQWLAGEGAGSWFLIAKNKNHYYITRYSPAGKIECEGNFSVNLKSKFNIDQPFKFVHLCHCQRVHIQQGGNEYVLERIPA